MNELTIPNGFLSNERVFNKTIDFFIGDINVDDNLLFVSDIRLDKEVIKIVDLLTDKLKFAYDIQQEQYSKSFSDYFEEYKIDEVLTEKIKNIIIEKNSELLTYRQHRTKMNATNLVLLDILLNLNDKSSQLTNYSDPESMPEIKSNIIYDLCTNEINKALHKDYFISEELKLRVDQKNTEFTVQKKIAGLRNKLDRLETKYKRKRKKIIDNRRSYINKLRRAKKDLYTKTKELEGQEKEDLYDKLLFELNQDKKKLSKIKSKSFKELETIKKDYEKELKDPEKKIDLKKDLNDLLSKKKEFPKQNKILSAKIENLRREKAEFFSTYKPLNKAVCDKKKDQYHFFRDKMLLPNPLSIPPDCVTKEELLKFKKNKRDIIDNCIDYLRSYNLITHHVIAQKNEYQLNLDTWFTAQKHHLDNLNVIKELLPLLISYLKYNAPNKVDGFLSHIDEIIDYLFLAPEKFSDNYQNEQVLLKAISDNYSIDISIYENNKDTLFTNISDYYIEFNENGDKTLNWSNNDKYYSYSIDTVTSISISIQSEDIIEKDKEDSSISERRSNFSVEQQKYNIPDRKHYNIILEADTNLVDFFNIKPLENQIIYKTKSEKKQFCKDHNIEVPAENKIYITAKDQTEAVIHVVKRCIPSVKILEPSVIKNKFRDIIKSMCDEM